MGFLESHKTNIYLQIGPVLQRFNTEEEQNENEKKKINERIITANS